MVSFIIPVYNKGQILFKTLSSLIKKLSKSYFQDYEIVIVNDGSTDNSLEEAVRFKKFNGDTGKIRIFYYQKNIGKGFALRFGFSKSLGNTVVFLDGDLDINTSQVINALKIYKTKQPDMVIGSKYLPESRIYYPLNRYFYSILLKLIIKILFNLSISDTQVGLKIFRREVLDEIFPRLIIKRFAMDLEMLVVAKKLKFSNIIEVPVMVRHSQINSSIDLWAVKNFSQDIAAIFYRKNILRYYDHKIYKIIYPSLTIQTA